jgi:hypothetical protein
LADANALRRQAGLARGSAGVSGEDVAAAATVLSRKMQTEHRRVAALLPFVGGPPSAGGSLPSSLSLKRGIALLVQVQRATLEFHHRQAGEDPPVWPEETPPEEDLEDEALD